MSPIIPIHNKLGGTLQSQSHALNLNKQNPIKQVLIIAKELQTMVGK
jgi:hypothetical protein